MASRRKPRLDRKVLFDWSAGSEPWPELRRRAGEELVARLRAAGFHPVSLSLARHVAAMPPSGDGSSAPSSFDDAWDILQVRLLDALLDLECLHLLSLRYAVEERPGRRDVERTCSMMRAMTALLPVTKLLIEAAAHMVVGRDGSVGSPAMDGDQAGR